MILQLSRLAIVTFVVFWLAAQGFAGEASLMKTKQEAETKGYLFEVSHDEIVAKARKETKLKLFSALDAQRTLRELSERFKAKYPFVADIQFQEKAESEIQQRFLLEIKAGLAKGWDAISMRTDLHSQFLPHLKKIDMLGMARHGVLEIPLQIIDPAARNIVAITSDTQVVAYNKKLIAADKVPGQWEDFLKPEFKGRKFCADIRPVVLSALVPVWGLEKVLNLAGKIAAQEPVWVRGNARALTGVAAGEHAMFMGPNFGAVKVLQGKAGNIDLEYKVIEPAPVRLNQGSGVLDTSEHPYTALLWLEFLTSLEAQKIIDKHEPGEASAFAPGSIQGDVVRGKKVSLIQLDSSEQLAGWQKEIAKAYGFPNAELK